jgi:hypothetical protein
LGCHRLVGAGRAGACPTGTTNRLQRQYLTPVVGVWSRDALASGAPFATPEALWGGDAALHKPGRQTVHQLGAWPSPARPMVAPPEHRACARNIAARTTGDEPALPCSGAARRAFDGGL